MANGASTASLLGTALLGQRASDVVVPELEALQRVREERRRRLAGLAANEEETPAQRQLREEGTRAQVALGAATRGRVASTRGPAQLLAARSAGAQEASGRAQIAGQVSRVVAELGAAERARAEQTLGEAIVSEEAGVRAMREEQERRRRRGLLPTLATIGGALIGAGGGATGAQLGAGLSAE